MHALKNVKPYLILLLLASALVALACRSENPETDTEVYVTKTGRKYHRGTCSFLGRSKIPITLSEAKVKGYTPCSKCFADGGRQPEDTSPSAPDTLNPGPEKFRSDPGAQKSRPDYS